ncbi:hypothetical protein [Streptomyces sp. RKND-216]|uniref:hypothetical protein n=1 Tax=Streptomyces sp. RKND-216 TaxID=2562581 RepID=UPI001447D1C6|nr:hypothetical protein [Streptomyces sp. RKND-216]
MQKNVRRTTPTAAAAVAALAALVLTGCGGASEAADDAKPGDEKKTEAPAAPAMSQGDLEKLALAEGDVEGFTVEKGAADDVMPPPKGAKAEPAECGPYADLFMKTAPGEPGPAVLRTVSEKQETPALDGDGDLDMDELEAFEDAMDDAFDVQVVRVGVAGYGGDGAADAMKELRDWTGACQGGFAVGPQKQGVTDVVPDAPARGTDEATTFTVTVDTEGKKIPMSRFAVYRDGDTVVTFMAMNGAALLGEGGGDWGVPEAVVEAQLGKLG